MSINRNFLFLEFFSVMLVLAVVANIGEFVATLISNDPNGYLFILIGYIVVFCFIGFAIYKITYKPPKYEKMVSKARKKETKLIDGLKTKIETFDDKQAKQKEKREKKRMQAQKIPSSQVDFKPSNSISKVTKSKTTRRRR